MPDLPQQDGHKSTLVWLTDAPMADLSARRLQRHGNPRIATALTSTPSTSVAAKQKTLSPCPQHEPKSILKLGKTHREKPVQVWTKSHTAATLRRKWLGEQASTMLDRRPPLPAF